MGVMRGIEEVLSVHTWFSGVFPGQGILQECAADAIIGGVMNNHNLETTKEVAARYGVAPRTVLKWASAGVIPVAVKVGGELERDSQDQKHRIDDINQKIRDLTEDKIYQSRKYQKEIKEWEKNKEKIHGKIKDIEKQNRPLFTSLGRLINEKRIERKELTLFYSKIDRTVKRKLEIEGQIQELD